MDVKRLRCAKCMREGYIMNLWGGKWVCMDCYIKAKREYDIKYEEEELKLND